jgi:hypothetical protein
MANFLARLLKDAKELATVMRCTDKKCLEITASSVQGCIKWPDECFPYGKPIVPSRPRLMVVGQVHYE